jgi:septation ring formation regulator EzrA
LAEKQDLLKQVRDHFQRYQDLNSKGRYSEAGKELEAIQKLLHQ